MFFVFFFALLLFLMEGKRPKKKFTFQTFFVVVVVCTVSSSLEADAPLRLIKIRRVLFYFFNFFFFFRFPYVFPFCRREKPKKSVTLKSSCHVFFVFFLLYYYCSRWNALGLPDAQGLSVPKITGTKDDVLLFFSPLSLVFFCFSCTAPSIVIFFQFNCH